MNNECEGCRAFDIGKCIIQIKPSIKHHNCPCINCLVKAMCTQLCKEFLDYVHYYRKNISESNPLPWKRRIIL